MCLIINLFHLDLDRDKGEEQSDPGLDKSGNQKLYATGTSLIPSVVIVKDDLNLILT